MHRKRLLNSSERSVRSILGRRLKGSGYQYVLKPRLGDVIDKDPQEWLTDHEFSFLGSAHLDFVLTNGASDPVLAVEFDGPCHNGPEQAARDVIKNRLCRSADLPLLRIGPPEILEHDKVTILEYILELFFCWQLEESAMEREVQEFAREGERSDPEADPASYDPYFRFWLRHPFPATKRLRERLLHQHGIDTYGNATLRGGAKLACDMVPGDIGPNEANEQFHRMAWAAIVTRYVSGVKEVRIERGSPDGRYTVMKDGRSEPVLFYVERAVSIRDWLPTDYNVPSPAEIGRAYASGDWDELVGLVEERVKHIWIPLGSAAPSWNVAYELGHYLSLRAVEEWAKQSKPARRLAGGDIGS